MSTYPATLDDLGATNPVGSDPMTDGAGHAAQHAAANDAIDAIQTTLGVDPQGGETDVAARLDAIEASIGGGGGGSEWADVDSNAGTGLSRVTLDSILDTAYEFELDLHATAVSGSAVTFTLLARLSGSSITSGSYYWGGWANGWGGGLVAWTGNGATSRALNYASATDLMARARLRYDVSGRWACDVLESRNAVSGGLVCASGGYISSDADGINFGPASGTWTGSWTVRKRLIPT